MHLADDDLAWAQPYLETGENSLARGEGLPGEEFLSGLDRRLDMRRWPWHD